MHNARNRMVAALALALLMGAVPTGAALANVTYTYDNLGRLASAAYDSGMTVYYSYDLSGNRLTQVVQANSTVGVWGSFNWGAAKW